MLNPNRAACQTITGVNLVEMMVTLAILVIVLSLGAPAMARWVRDSEVRSSAETLRSILQRTRAEAVSRNTLMRVSLGDAHGHPAWVMGCVRISAVCPAQLFQHAAEMTGKVRWGAAKSAKANTVKIALEAGDAMPGTVDFYPFGDAPKVAEGTDIARIDVFHAIDDRARRLIVSIDGGGNIRLCDPELLPPDPGACK